MNSKVTPCASLSFQNEEMRKVACDSYDWAALEAAFLPLAERDTLRLMRYKSGGCSAVTPLDWFCLDSAMDGLLINMWDRDNVFQALGELYVEIFPWLSAKMKHPPEPGAWRHGLMSSLKHHARYQNRLLDIITDRKSGYDFMARPHIRYNPSGLYEIPDHWGHAQNDALGSINFMLFWALNRGYLNWDDRDIQEIGKPVAILTHHFFWKVCVWMDWDLGAWEDKRAEHASSVGVVLTGLREQADWLKSHGQHITYCTDGKCYEVTEEGVRQLIAKCESKLREILPNEFVRSDNDEVRTVDAALLNALFLSALSGRPLLDDAMNFKIIENVERDLMKHIGIARYPNDVWDGRVNRPGVPEAQWCHPSPMLSLIFGEHYRRTGDQSSLERQVFHFNRTLAQVNSRWHVPEAYIVDPESGAWVSDANESLAWAQAMTICAFGALGESLEHQKQQALVSPPMPAAPPETAADKTSAGPAATATATAKEAAVAPASASELAPPPSLPVALDMPVSEKQGG